MHSHCILCGADVEFSVSKYYPATRWEPAGGGDIEDITPECDCANSPCVDEGKYYDLMEERIRFTAAFSRDDERETAGCDKYHQMKDEGLL